jgi:hypothetical protein
MKPSAALLATGVAAMLIACGADNAAKETTTPAAKKTASVKCVGINTCKGTSECGGGPGGSSCHGQNACKGNGWVSVPTESDCTGKGGKLLAAK